MTAREVLLRMADYIERHGWRQGAFGVVGGPCCIRGAAIAVCGTDAESMTLAYRRIASHLGLRTDGYTKERIADWNDATGRTAAEVISALRAAAAGGAS